MERRAGRRAKMRKSSIRAERAAVEVVRRGRIAVGDRASRGEIAGTVERRASSA